MRLEIEEEEKKEGPLKTNDKNSDYEDDPFDVEPVGKDGKTTGSISQKTVNVNVTSKYETSVFESSVGSPSKQAPQKNQPIDPQTWSKARVELADLLRQFG